MRTSIVLSSALALLSVACSSSSTSIPDGGTSPRDAAADASTTPADSGTPDSGIHADATTSVDSGIRGDAAVVHAQLDQRCNYLDRVGILTVSDQGGPLRYLSLGLNDKPLPWLGPPEIVDGACIFHRAARNTGCMCTGDQVCSYAGACVDPPVPVASATVQALGANDRRQFTGDGSSLGGEITLPDAELSLILYTGDLTVHVPPMATPAALTNAMGTLTGTEMMPIADITWSAGASTASVSTHIRINHHVGEPTFTECVVPAQVGRMHIGQDMLTPLAVVTGLEFQGLEHVRYARAMVPTGCLEIRYTTQTYVNLVGP